MFLRCISGINMSRGLLIFVVFICKPSIWNLEKEQLRVCMGFGKPYNDLLGARVEVVGNDKDSSNVS